MPKACTTTLQTQCLRSCSWVDVRTIMTSYKIFTFCQKTNKPSTFSFQDHFHNFLLSLDSCSLTKVPKKLRLPLWLSKHSLVWSGLDPKPEYKGGKDGFIRESSPCSEYQQICKVHIFILIVWKLGISFAIKVN